MEIYVDISGKSDSESNQLMTGTSYNSLSVILGVCVDLNQNYELKC